MLVTGLFYQHVLLQVLCALAFYGEGSYRRIIGMMSSLNVSQGSVSNAVAEVTDALNHDKILARFIRFPRNPHGRAFLMARLVRSFLSPCCLEDWVIWE